MHEYAVNSVAGRAAVLVVDGGTTRDAKNPVRLRVRAVVDGVLVELRGFEPLAFSLRTRRATNCATAP